MDQSPESTAYPFEPTIQTKSYIFRKNEKMRQINQPIGPQNIKQADHIKAKPTNWIEWNEIKPNQTKSNLLNSSDQPTNHIKSNL